MDFHGNINLQYNEMKQMVVQQEVNFPVVPKIGRVVFKDSKLFMCVDITNNVPAWIPITNKITTYVHTQSVASTSWTVGHNLNFTAPVVQIYDSAGNMIIPDTVVPIDNNSMNIIFSSTISGTAVVLYGDILQDSAPLPIVILGFNALTAQLDLTISNNDQTMVHDITNPALWRNAISDISYPDGDLSKRYLEITIGAGTPDGWAVGFGGGIASGSGYAGSPNINDKGITIWGDGSLHFSQTTTLNATPGFNTGDVIGMAIEPFARNVYYTINGVRAFDGVLSTDFSADHFVSASLRNSNQELTANFGAQPFVYSGPVGYSSWDDRQGPQSGPVTIAEQHFSLNTGTLSPDKLTATGTILGARGAISTISYISGSYYFETTINNTSKIGLVGSITYSPPGNTKFSVLLDPSSGSIQLNGSPFGNLGFVPSTSVIGICIDINNLLTHLYIDGIEKGAGFVMNPGHRWNASSAPYDLSSFNVNYGGSGFLAIPGNLPPGTISWDGTIVD